MKFVTPLKGSAQWERLSIELTASFNGMVEAKRIPIYYFKHFNPIPGTIGRPAHPTCQIKVMAIAVINSL